MYRVCKTFQVETGHFLSKLDDERECKMPHGHSRTIEVVIRAEELDENNMVIDFDSLKAAFSNYMDSLDHAMLINTNSKHYEYFRDNFSKVIPFEDKDPTSEVIAQTLFKYLDKALQPGNEHKDKKGIKYTIRGNIKLERVRVWETSSSWAEYTE